MEFYGLCKGLIENNIPNVKILEMYEGRFSEFCRTIFQEQNDIIYYKNLVKEYGDQVLELGCGTGRILILLLQAGIHAVGLDASSDMLNELKIKAKAKKCVPKVILGDMTEYLGESLFNIVLLPDVTISVVDDYHKLFQNVYRNLLKGGVFSFSYLELMNQQKNMDYPYEIIFEQGKPAFCIMYSKIDSINSKELVNLYLEDIDESGITHRYITAVEKNIFSREQIEKSFQSAGFHRISRKSIDLKQYRYVDELLIKL